MKNFKRFTILILLLFLYITISAVSYTNAVCRTISDSVFRLHVIANSDSAEDQNLKYIVRDSVLEYMNYITCGVTQKEKIIEIISNNLENFKEKVKKPVAFFLKSSYNWLYDCKARHYF